MLIIYKIYICMYQNVKCSVEICVYIDGLIKRQVKIMVFLVLFERFNMKIYIERQRQNVCIVGLYFQGNEYGQEFFFVFN